MATATFREHAQRWLETIYKTYRKSKKPVLWEVVHELLEPIKRLIESPQLKEPRAKRDSRVLRTCKCTQRGKIRKDLIPSHVFWYESEGRSELISCMLSIKAGMQAKIKVSNLINTKHSFLLIVTCSTYIFENKNESMLVGRTSRI